MSGDTLDSNSVDIRSSEPIPVSIVSQPRPVENIEAELGKLQAMQMLLKAELEQARKDQERMHEQNQKDQVEGLKLVNDYLRWRDHTDFRLKVVQWSAIVGAVASVFRALQDFILNVHHGS